MIAIYGQDYCSYTRRAIDLCIEKNIPYEYHNMDNVKKQEMMKTYQSKTIPIVLVNSMFIGGYTELCAWVKKTRL